MKIQIFRINDYYQILSSILSGRDIDLDTIEFLWGGFYETESATPQEVWDAINWTGYSESPPDGLHIVGPGGCCSDVIFCYPDGDNYVYVLALPIGFTTMKSLDRERILDEIKKYWGKK